MSTETLAATASTPDPRRYFEQIDRSRAAEASRPPVCLYLEVTNRCNLLCETCPRTFETLEPPADMSWELFTRIVDQIPGLQRAVLHGVGEPMLVRELPRMVRYLKDRGVYVLFNTDYQRTVDATTPRVSLWLTGLKETVAQLPEFIRLAADMGVYEVHLQRLVFDEAGFGMARAESSLFERIQAEEQEGIATAAELGRMLGVTLDASGATEPSLSLKQAEGDQPWSLCRRPWSLMYFTAHGRALPCCIAPFSARGYDGYTLGDATQQSLREMWNGEAYRDFRTRLLGDNPPKPCQGCGLRWRL